MLPLRGPGGGGSVAGLNRHGSGSVSGYLADDLHQRSHLSLLRYLRRVVYYPQMDFEYTFTQMLYLLRSPSKVYKLTSWRNQTKAQWARDDPAFLVILSVLITVCSIAYTLALGSGSLTNILGQVAVHLSLFLGSGVLIATFWWHLANTYFRTRHSHSVDQEVEWMYAFDIHCNGYWPVVLSLYVAQFLMLPFLLSNSFLATFVANSLYALTLAYYTYVSFLGYMYLPFLNKELVTSMLYPIVAVVLLYVLFTVLNINASRFALSFFFTAAAAPSP